MLKSQAFFQKNYIRGAFIAKGCYGKVYEVFDKKSKKKYALKIIESDVRTADRKSQWGSLTNYLPDIVQLFIEKHPSIANIILFFEGRDQDSGLQTFNILMEYLHETLEQEMISYKENGKLYGFPHVLKMFMSLAQGLHFLQIHHIAHRDLKPSNIMRDKYGNYKLIDLGISIPNFDRTLTQRRTIAGTLMFMAPEILKAFIDGAQEVEYNPHKSDCYSLGVVMLKVCLVDEDVSALGIQNEEAVLKKQVMLNKVCRRYNRTLMKVMEVMLEPDPGKRPDFKELLEMLAVVGDSEENEARREQLMSLGNSSLIQHKELLMRNRVITSSNSSLNSFQMIESSPFPMSQSENSGEGLTINLPSKKHSEELKTNPRINQTLFISLILYLSFENIMTVTNTSIIQRQIYGDVSNNILGQGITENYVTSTFQGILYVTFPILASAGIERYGCYPTLIFSIGSKLLIQTCLLIFEKVYSSFWPAFFCVFVSLLTCINVDLVLTTILIKTVRTQRISTLFAIFFISFKSPGMIFFLPSFTNTEDSVGIFISSTVVNYCLFFVSLAVACYIRVLDKNSTKQPSGDLNQPLISSNSHAQIDLSVSQDLLGKSSDLSLRESKQGPPGRLKSWRAVLVSDFLWLMAFFFAITNSIQYQFKEQVFLLYVRKNLQHFERERNRYMILLAVSLFSSPVIGIIVDKTHRRFDILIGLLILILLNFILSIATEGLEGHLYHLILYSIYYGGFYSIFLPCIAVLTSKKSLTLALCIIYSIENFFFSVLDFMLVNSFDSLNKNKVGFKVMSALLTLLGVGLFLLQRKRRLNLLNGPLTFHHLD